MCYRYRVCAHSVLVTCLIYCSDQLILAICIFCRFICLLMQMTFAAMAITIQSSCEIDLCTGNIDWHAHNGTGTSTKPMPIVHDATRKMAQELLKFKLMPNEITFTFLLAQFRTSFSVLMHSIRHIGFFFSLLLRYSTKNQRMIYIHTHTLNNYSKVVRGRFSGLFSGCACGSAYICILLNRYIVCYFELPHMIHNNLRLHIIIIFLYQAIITSLRFQPTESQCSSLGVWHFLCLAYWQPTVCVC